MGLRRVGNPVSDPARRTAGVESLAVTMGFSTPSAAFDTLRQTPGARQRGGAGATTTGPKIVAMRPLVLLVLLPSLLLLAGCIGPLATMLARGPEAVAKQMGQAAGYQAASGIAGSELGRETTATADTLANLDRIAREHPDALNADEVEQLKRKLAEDMPPAGAEEAPDGTSIDGDAVTGDASLHGPAAQPPSPHDRRRERLSTGPRDRTVGMLGDEDIGLPEELMTTSNRLRIERPGPIDQRWRPTDPHRFTQPRQTSFDEDQPPQSLQSLTGEAFAPRDFSRVMLPEVGTH